MKDKFVLYTVGGQPQYMLTDEGEDEIQNRFQRENQTLPIASKMRYIGSFIVGLHDWRSRTGDMTRSFQEALQTLLEINNLSPTNELVLLIEMLCTRSAILALQHRDKL